MDKTAVVIIIILIVLGAGFWAWQSGIFSSGPVQVVPIPEGIILFYGDGCPHCKNVDDFVEQNNIKDKVEFSNLEVWFDKNNQNVLAQIVNKCEIPVKDVGIPFLWDGAKCYVGQDDVINFFKDAADIQ